MIPNPQFPADIGTFTEDIITVNLILCGVSSSNIKITIAGIHQKIYLSLGFKNSVQYWGFATAEQ